MINHSLIYDFEELQPEIDGIRLEVLFNGTATLESDGDGFYVRSIAIDATTASPFEKTLLGRKTRKPTYLVVNQASIHECPLKGALYAMLSKALYADEAASEAWAAEMSEAA